MELKSAEEVGGAPQDWGFQKTFEKRRGSA